MKNVIYTVLLMTSVSSFGQIILNINRTSGSFSTPIVQIDSIRFTNNQMEIVQTTGAPQNEVLNGIVNVTFSGQPMLVWPVGTVHCSTVPTAIVDVTNPTTGKIWMDRNLGGSQVATSKTNAASYGDLYQWGRGADGHQCRNSPTTTTLSSVNQPANGNFILVPNSPYDWRSPQNDNLWQGVNGVNNPCPTGYRVPTLAEFDAESLTWTGGLNAAGAFASPLKLTMAGHRDDSNGSLIDVGVLCRYWSSTVSGTDSRFLHFDNSFVGFGYGRRARGGSIRCIKN